MDVVAISVHGIVVSLGRFISLSFIRTTRMETKIFKGVFYQAYLPECKCFPVLFNCYLLKHKALNARRSTEAFVDCRLTSLIPSLDFSQDSCFL